MGNGGSCQSREWEKYAFSESSEIQSSGRHFWPNTSRQPLLAVSFFILEEIDSDSLTIIEPLSEICKRKLVQLSWFYHLVCLSSSSYLTLYLFLECLLYSKHSLNFWNFQGEWDLPLPWRNSRFSGKDRHLKGITIHLIRSVKGMKDCSGGIELPNWCCLRVGKS